MSAEVLAEICNESGVCAPVDPVTALIIIGVKQLVNELNKGADGFGPNGAIIKAVNTVANDLQNGLGPNNDLVRAWETIRNDLTHGMGPNNDIVKALNALSIRL